MIHVIGNSHVSTFSNKTVPPVWMSYESEYFVPVHLGAITAYNFYNNHKEYIISYLNERVKDTDKVTFIAGEVDCRLHLPLQADQQKKSDEIIVRECIDRFKELFNLALKLNKNVFAFGTHATTNEGHSMSNMDRPIYGDMKRRNNICLLWNKYLEEMSNNLNIKYTSIYNKLVNQNNETIMDYMADYCHLQSFKIYPFIIEEFKNKGII